MARPSADWSWVMKAFWVTAEGEFSMSPAFSLFLATSAASASAFSFILFIESSASKTSLNSLLLNF